MCIRERASRSRRSLLVEVSNLIEGTTAELVRIRQEADGQSTGSSGSSSFDLLSSEDAGEEAAGKLGTRRRTSMLKKAKKSIRSKIHFQSLLPQPRLLSPSLYLCLARLSKQLMILAFP